MKATYSVPFPPETSLPAQDLLQYPRPGAPEYNDGGWSTIGITPLTNRCICVVDSSPATHAAMQADAKYLLIEVLAEPEVIP
jgi:hypothetical protein